MFIDGRVDVYGAKVLRLYAAVRNAEPGWEKILADYSVDICVLATAQSTESRLLAALHRSPDWALVFWDNVSAVYVRRAPDRQAFLQHAPTSTPCGRTISTTPSSQSPEGLARAERDYRTKLREDPDCALAAYGLAECLSASAAGAQRRWTFSGARSGSIRKTPRSRYSLGVALLGTGKLDEAERALLATLALHQNEFEAHLALSVLYQKEGRLDAALRHCRRPSLSRPPTGNGRPSGTCPRSASRRATCAKRSAAAQEVLRLQPEMTAAAERVRAQLAKAHETMAEKAGGAAT